MFKPFEIVVGRGEAYDPAPGTTDCNIPVIKGMVIWVEKIGYGQYDYNKYVTLSAGGFRLTDTTFSNGERFAVHVEGMAYGTAASSYTNGFNLAQVMSALFGRIGWLQPDAAGSPVINSTNLLSKSGRKFNDGSFHAAVTVRNIKSEMEEAKASDTNLNAYLESLQRAAIMKTLTSVFNQVEYLSQALLYNTFSFNRELVKTGDDFVGIEIYIPPVTDKAVQIDNVSILLDSDKTFNLYLYNSHKKLPVWVGEVTVVANEQTVINLSDIILTHMGGANHGGVFYFGYYQSDLGLAKAYNHSYKSECHEHFFRWRFMEADKSASEYDFDRVNIRYSNNSYGLNVHLSAFVDHSWQVAQKAALFDNAIGLNLSHQVLEQIVFGKRLNGDSRALKDTLPSAILLADIRGVSQISNVPKIQSLREMIELEEARLRDSFYGKPKPMSVSIC